MLELEAHHSLYGFFIEKTAKKYKQLLQRNFHQHGFDITVDQWVVLSKIQENDGIYQNELAEQTHKDAPTVTRIIDLLVQKQLAKRLPDEIDRRKTMVVLTEAGKLKYAEVEPHVVKMRRKGWEGLSNDDYRELSKILNTILSNIEGYNSSD